MPSPPASSLRESLRLAPRDRSALVALGLGTVAGSWVAAAAPWPLRRDAAGPWLGDPWASAQLPSTAGTGSFATLLGLADHGARHDLLGVCLVIACGTVAGSLAHAFFRGKGREIAAVAAIPLSVAVLARWLRAGPALDPLIFTLLALLSVRAIVRPLVQLGRVTPVAAGRALAGAGTCCLIDPAAGMGLAALVSAICVFRRQNIQPSDAGATMRGLIHPRARTEILRWGPAFAIGIAFPTALALAWVGSGAEVTVPDLHDLHLAPPPIGALRRYLGLPALFPAVALVLLLSLPLRWRGGPTVTLLLGFALVIHRGEEPLCPMPVLLVSLVVAACGWVWLAGSAVQSRRLARGLAVCSALVVISLGLFVDSGSGPRPRLPTALADSRAPQPLSESQMRALVAPGDVLLVHDPISFAELRSLQAREGARPDVTLIDARTAEPDALALLSMSFASEGQRVLSDSFDLAGRWPKNWAVDSGPFFWFTFSPVLETDVIALESLSWLEVEGRLDPHERSRWVRLHIERARHRRALGQHADAAAALPLPAAERQRLSSDVKVARALRVSAIGTTRLRQLDPEHPLAAWAEAGDLLFESGQLERGHEVLSEAAEAGNAPAWGALTRWQLEAGEGERARESFEALIEDPSLEPEALFSAWWLIDHGRHEEASRLLDRVPAGESQSPYEQLALRLRLLRSE